MKMPSLAELMKAGAHFGHRHSKWHPKMQPYIFTEKNGIHVINLEETQKQLVLATDFLTQTVSAGGTVLFLGTKRQAQDIVKEAAIRCGMPYIVSRWLGGTLTNSHSILGLVKKYNKLKDDRATGRLSRYTKKEQLMMARDMETLDGLIGGIASMERIPEAIFIVDIKEEKTAVLEARKKHVPVVAICDTNVNPDLVDWPVPANDDATNSIKVIVNVVADAIAEARAAMPQKEVKPVIKATPKAEA